MRCGRARGACTPHFRGGGRGSSSAPRGRGNARARVAAALPTPSAAQPAVRQRENPAACARCPGLLAPPHGGPAPRGQPPPPPALLPAPPAAAAAPGAAPRALGARRSAAEGPPPACMVATYAPAPGSASKKGPRFPRAASRRSADAPAGRRRACPRLSSGVEAAAPAMPRIHHCRAAATSCGRRPPSPASPRTGRRPVCRPTTPGGGRG
jgi:hypothetical protein